jgi:hypothetical protein
MRNLKEKLLKKPASLICDEVMEDVRVLQKVFIFNCLSIP